MQDRRSGTERRSTNTLSGRIRHRMGRPGGRVPGSLSDISIDGCFVLCSGEVEDGERVRIFVPLADGMRVEFSGVVANSVFEIGFGVKFDQLSNAQRELLIRMVRDTGEV
ncbi:MAG: PilZ domain-containing protein [Acidobacteria bacterium]|nr:PilZ domain-containing protein [Acidobacteriota bacterium]